MLQKGRRTWVLSVVEAEPALCGLASAGNRHGPRNWAWAWLHVHILPTRQWVPERLTSAILWPFFFFLIYTEDGAELVHLTVF